MSRTASKPRFQVLPFTNERTGSKSWRVTGTKRDGCRIRENFADIKAARCRQVDLENEWLARETVTAIRATDLTDAQLRLAESAFLKLDDDAELLRAVDYWREHGRQSAVEKSVRLDDAVAQFIAWLDGSDCLLRERTKGNLRLRVQMFGTHSRNKPMADITPDDVESFLEGRKVSAVSKDNHRRALSRFFRWCIQRPRKWMRNNPAREVKISNLKEELKRKKGEGIAILSVDECRALLDAAQSYKEGRLLPYTVLAMFAGLRPDEAKRITWQSINMVDCEIVIEGQISKRTDSRRVMPFRDGHKQQGPFNKCLRAWLDACQGREICPRNWRNDFDAIKRMAGFGGRTIAAPGLKPWVTDVLRHTAITHFVRLVGSYGTAAEVFGNSEGIIKSRYQGRVTSEQTRLFYAIRPQ